MTLLALGAFAFTAAPGASAQDSVLTIDRELTDDSVKSEEPFDVSTGSFTVAVRAKLINEGNEPGNGDNLGMVWNVSNGWDSGARVHYSWGNFRLAFQIGREGGNVSVWTDRGYYPGVMRDIVSTYDGETKLMRFYIDGYLVGSTTFDAELNMKDMPLNVGFGGSGVGSSHMYVEKAESWTRALTAEEVKARQSTRSESELLAVRILRGLESSANVADDIGLGLDTLRAAVRLELPEAARVRVRAALVAALIDRGFAIDRSLKTDDYDELAALVFEDADAAVAAADGSDATRDSLNLYGATVRNLRSVADISSANAIQTRKLMTSTSFSESQKRQFREAAQGVAEKFNFNATRAGALLKKLDETYPAETALFAKISKLENSVERVQAIERDALAVYYGLVSAPRSEKYARHIAVAPNGSDETGNGSTRAPYQTLNRALRDVRENADGKKVVVDLAAGEYFVSEPAILTGISNVTILGSTTGVTKLTGSRRVSNFMTLKSASEKNASSADASGRFAKSAAAKILVADLAAAGVKDLGKLQSRGYHPSDKVNAIPTFTLNGKAQTIARWPNAGEETLKFGEKVEDVPGAPETSSSFRYDFDRVDGWKLSGTDEDDVWAFGLYEWEWAANFRRVLKIDRENKVLTFDYRNGTGRFDYYFVNVLEELDTPGEYYVDRASGLLYFYPPEGFESAEALNRAFAEYDEFEGRFAELEDATDVVFSNVTFSGGRDTAVVMKNCKRCYVTDSTIEQMGGNAVVINGGGDCGVVNTRMRNLGASGVRVFGGDRETLAHCRHFVHNNYVSDFSRIDRVYAPAVLAEGCGVAITNNLFCDSPHHALRTDGNDLYIARNEVHSVVYEYSDQSGVDIYCDPSYRGIVIERNLWRHIGSSFALCGQAGIRLDDSISGVVMMDNVFYRSSGGAFGGIQIHGGKDNLVVNNAFVNCIQALSFSPWHGDRYEKFVKERFPAHIGNALYERTYPFFDDLFNRYDMNFVLGNQAINCQRFNNNGDKEEVFVGNTMRTEVPDLKKLGVKNDDGKSAAEVFYTDSKALRKWLSDVSGISLKDVGLKANWNGAGEDVSPNFIGGAGAEK